jgi:hypothetical protein
MQSLMEVVGGRGGCRVLCGGGGGGEAGARESSSDSAGRARGACFRAMSVSL